MGSLFDQVIRLGIKEGYGARWIEKLVPIIHGFPDNLPLEDMISMNSAFLWKKFIILCKLLKINNFMEELPFVSTIGAILWTDRLL